MGIGAVMKEAIDVTTDEETDAALERAKRVPGRPNAISATYNADLNLVILQLNNGRRLAIPREMLQGLSDANPEQLSEIKIHCGVDIAWPQLDVDHYLPYLLEGSYGSEKWMKSLQEAMVAAPTLQEDFTGYQGAAWQHLHLIARAK